MRSISLPILAFATLMLASIAAPASGQLSTTRGFMIGVHGSGASLSIEEQDRNEAGGAGLIVAYGFNRRFAVFAQFDGGQFDEQSSGSIVGDWTMTHVDVGMRFHFANSLRRWPPLPGGRSPGDPRW